MHLLPRSDLHQRNYCLLLVIFCILLVWACFTYNTSKISMLFGVARHDKIIPVGLYIIVVYHLAMIGSDSPTIFLPCSYSLQPLKVVWCVVMSIKY